MSTTMLYILEYNRVTEKSCFMPIQHINLQRDMQGML